MLLGVEFTYTKGDWRKAPNLISYVRLLLGPGPAVLILAQPHNATAWWWALGLFVFVAATDVVDGFVARRFNLITDLGKFIDPLVDKILVFLTLIALSIINPWLWPVTAIITLREVVITVQIRTRGRLVAAVKSGKYKMVAQVAMIVALLAPLGGWWVGVQWTLVVLALFMTIFSWVDYHRKFVAQATRS